jgi:hypothetical protein
MHRGLLFTREFLKRGIVETGAWAALSHSEVDRFRTIARSIFMRFPVNGSPNEATTERDLIFKVMEALGWEDILVQQSASSKRRTDIPDALLFADAEAKRRANAERTEATRYKYAVAVLENKAWRMPLDRTSKSSEPAPSTQILRYLSLAEVQSDQRIHWAILTNGQVWRLYYQKAKSRAEEFCELNLQRLLKMSEQSDLFVDDADADHWLRVFVLIFRPAAFVPGPEDDRTFLQVALHARQWWQEKVTADLSKLVFEELFGTLVRPLLRTTRQLRRSDRSMPTISTRSRRPLWSYCIACCSCYMQRIATFFL